MEDSRIKKLKQYGCELEQTKNRFLGDEQLYLECLQMFLEDEAFAILQDALEQNQYETAFEQAHTLKGVAMNLGLTPFVDKISVLLEKLRQNRYENLQDDYVKVLDEKKKIKMVLTKKI